MPIDDLDARIRSLVSDAVAAAPPPPELDVAVAGRTAPVVSLSAVRSRRWLATLTAAAAIMGVVLLANRDTNTPPGTATTVIDTTVPDASTTTPTGTVTTVIDTTVPDASTTTIAPDTTAVPQSTMTTMVVPAVEASVVTAGPDGVWMIGGDGTKVQWWGQPAAFAVAAPDGSVIVQIVLAAGMCTLDGTCTPADTTPLRLVGPNTSAVALSEGLPGGWMRLHDVARLLDGRVMALVEWQTTVDEGLDTEPGRLYAVDVQTGAVTAVSKAFGGWEEGSSRLHLAENGLVVGEYSSSITRSLFSAVVPGGAPLVTEPLSASAVGLEPFYDDCGDCPQLYAIDGTGTVVAWIHGDDLVVHSLATSTERRVPLDGRGDGASDIDIELQAEGDLGGPLLMVIEYRWSYGGERPAVVLVIDDEGVAEWDVGAPDRVSL